MGFEIIAVWENKAIKSERTWYTDTNGIELIRRDWEEGNNG